MAKKLYWIALDFTGEPNEVATECILGLGVCSLVFTFIIKYIILNLAFLSPTVFIREFHYNIFIQLRLQQIPIFIID